MVGFTAATPLQTALLKQISTVLEIQLTAPTVAAESLAFNDFHAELSAAAKGLKLSRRKIPLTELLLLCKI